MTQRLDEQVRHCVMQVARVHGQANGEGNKETQKKLLGCGDLFRSEAKSSQCDGTRLVIGTSADTLNVRTLSGVVDFVVVVAVFERVVFQLADTLSTFVVNQVTHVTCSVVRGVVVLLGSKQIE